MHDVGIHYEHNFQTVGLNNIANNALFLSRCQCPTMHQWKMNSPKMWRYRVKIQYNFRLDRKSETVTRWLVLRQKMNCDIVLKKIHFPSFLFSSCPCWEAVVWFEPTWGQIRLQINRIPWKGLLIWRVFFRSTLGFCVFALALLIWLLLKYTSKHWNASSISKLNKTLD